MTKHYQICATCVMDTSDPDITFNSEGQCNHCRDAKALIAEKGYRRGSSESELRSLVEAIKKDGDGREYDCILGMSGGVDSSYLAHLGAKLGLRILGVHIDAGWNSDIAVGNIQKLCDKLHIDLETVVIDWPAMKELQRAYMFSGLPNLDVPQDHVFAFSVYDFARMNNIKYVLYGGNYATEAILPKAWGQDAFDFVSLKSVYAEHGRGERILDKIPHFSYASFFDFKKRTHYARLLNYIDYSKSEAIELLEKEYGWKYYGGKHFESRFTKFFQSYYLPEKFGYDKRRAHFSSLIVNGEITRDDALKSLEAKYAYPLEEILEDLDYITKKLDITQGEWDAIMESPVKSVYDYKSYRGVKGAVSKLMTR